MTKRLSQQVAKLILLIHIIMKGYALSINGLNLIKVHYVSAGRSSRVME